MRRRAWTAAAVTFLTYGVLAGLRDYPWQLALLAAVAVGAFSFVALRTIAQLRAVSSAYSDPERWSADAEDPPGDSGSTGRS